MAQYTNKFGETLNISDAEAQKYGYTPKVAEASGLTKTAGLTLTPEKLAPASPIPVTEGITLMDTSGSTVAGATATSDYIKNIYPETEGTKLNQTFLNDIVSLTSDYGQKGTDQLKAEQDAGIAQMKQEYADLSGQIATKTAEYNALQSAEEKAVAGTEGQGRGITTGIIGGQQAALRRQFLAEKNAKASEIGLIQAQAQAKQGQINQAQDTVNRSIDLKYSAIENQLKVKQAQLEAIKPYLDKEEKILAERRQVILDKEKQDLADKKAAEKQKTDAVLGLMNDYPDAKIQLTDTIPQAQAKLANSKIYQTKVKSTSSGLGGVAGKVSSLTQAIIDNPSLFDDQTPTNKGKITAELQANGYDTSNLGIKGLSDTAINTISQSQKALSDLADLKTVVQNNLQYIGPISGFQKLNPWSKARQVQADVDRVKQTVGKALEGGVLRKEDEEKYKKILATLNDTPETAVYKINQIISSIQKDIENYKSLQQSSGRSLNVGSPLQKKGSAVTGSTSGGNSYTVTKE